MERGSEAGPLVSGRGLARTVNSVMLEGLRKKPQAVDSLVSATASRSSSEGTAAGFLETTAEKVRASYNHGLVGRYRVTSR